MMYTTFAVETRAISTYIKYLSNSQQLWSSRPDLFNLFNMPVFDYDDNHTDIEIVSENNAVIITVKQIFK